MRMGEVDYTAYENQLTLVTSKEDSIGVVSEPTEAGVRTLQVLTPEVTAYSLDAADQSADSDYAYSEPWVEAKTVDSQITTLSPIDSTAQEEEVIRTAYLTSAQNQIVDSPDFSEKTLEQGSFPSMTENEWAIQDEFEAGIKAAEQRLGIANLRPIVMIGLGIVAYKILMEK